MKQLTIFRIIIAAFITACYVSSWSMDTVAAVIIITLTTLFAIAYVSVEIGMYVQRRMGKPNWPNLFKVMAVMVAVIIIVSLSSCASTPRYGCTRSKFITRVPGNGY